jgi:hypothetical protein
MDFFRCQFYELNFFKRFQKRFYHNFYNNINIEIAVKSKIIILVMECKKVKNYLIFHLTKLNNLCIIKLENEKPQTWFTSIKWLKNTLNWASYRCVFLLVIRFYSKLLLML